MRIILLRHAERNSAGGENPGLSARGQKQSGLLVDLVLQHKLPLPSQLWASPQIRSQQTLLPLAKITHQELQIHDGLNERTRDESAAHFKLRVQEALARAENSQQTLYLCSHLDWIEEALLLIPSDSDLLDARYQTWSPATYMLFDIQDNLWQLTEFGGIKC